MDELLIILMAHSIDLTTARSILADAFSNAQAAWLSGVPASITSQLSDLTERLFSSATQAYREALVGCAVVRCLNDQINIRHPATDTSKDAFSGRTLSEQVVAPFLQAEAVPISKSPYLSSLRGGARFEPGGAPRIQRDPKGFDALVSIVNSIATGNQAQARVYLEFLLYRFLRLRDESNIGLMRVSQPTLKHLRNLIAGLLGARSGGRIPALLSTAMFKTISECHSLGWEVEFQGINVADAATGAVGDITIRKGGDIILGVEVTERAIDKGRVTSTFEQKVSPNSVVDYLFITSTEPHPAAILAAQNYTAVGHEMNFVKIDEWLINNLASIGLRCRMLFQERMLILLATQSADLKVLWNTQMALVTGQP